MPSVPQLLAGLPAISVAETLTLAPGIVDLWYCFYEDLDKSTAGTYEALLTPVERQRCTALHFECDRHQFLVTRALARTVLSCYAPVRPADWRFEADEYGKPQILSPLVKPDLYFNLANTRGLVVCAVSAVHQALGIDAERLESDIDVTALAEQYFSPSEVRDLKALPPADHWHRFFAYWTLKESYIKARGLGLTIPLDQFSFILREDAVDVVFQAELRDDAALWRFALVGPGPHHALAVGVNTGGAELSLRAARASLPY
ncbi:MAG: 4'-phosphopantetheinyl transferase superfamily protein [Acidobacteriota bacterium]